MIAEAYKTRYHFADPAPLSGSERLTLFYCEGQVVFAVTAADGRVLELADLSVESLPGTDHLASGKLEFVCASYKLMTRRFAQVDFIYLSQDFTLLPEAFSPSGFSRQLLDFSSGPAERRIIRAAHNGIQVVAGTEPDLLDFVERHFPGATIRHCASVTTCLVSSHHSLRNSQVFMNLHETRMELCVHNAGELRFYNVFSCAGDEDVLYYLLFTCSQMGLDPAQLRLAVAAGLPADGSLLSAIRRYFMHVQLVTQDPSVRMAGDLSRLPSHYYFTVLNQHLCAS